jgi:hypothetical protein
MHAHIQSSEKLEQNFMLTSFSARNLDLYFENIKQFMPSMYHSNVFILYLQTWQIDPTPGLYS